MFFKDCSLLKFLLQPVTWPPHAQPQIKTPKLEWFGGAAIRTHLPVMLLVILQSPVAQHLPKLQYQLERISLIRDKFHPRRKVKPVLKKVAGHCEHILFSLSQQSHNAVY